jgi:ATP-dependent helicase/nuclease subunit A
VSAGPPVPDQAQRDAAVAARGVNVLVDAGAGTGKTTLLIRRLVEMVAPEDDARPALPLSRIAAVTFTRKAAGELGLRLRQRLLAGLAGRPTPTRRARLLAALEEADTALVGTVHGFADRLLRLRPVEARLSPSHEVVDDEGALCRESFELLLQAAGAGRLADELAGSRCSPPQAREAEETVRDASAAGVRVESQEREWGIQAGLDALFQGFVLQRDVPPDPPAAAPFDLAELRQAVETFRQLSAGAAGSGAGTRWTARTASRLSRAAALEDPVAIWRDLRNALRRTDFKMKRDFPGDADGWEAYKAWTQGAEGGEPLRDAVTRPLRRWMATRLVRALPAVVAMYEKVKARRRALDQVDLLLRLRDLLRDHRAVRGDMQRLLDHVFVDEFQDTDPLQAEIVLYLCEEAPRARSWDEVRLAAGKLTVVGDPKQSIYRFRRADISVYERVRGIVEASPHLAVHLTASFRSEPALLGHLNDRFDEILGGPEPGQPDFDATSGAVANRRLQAGRAGRRAACVAALPYRTASGNVGDDRRREAEVLATWIRRAVEGGLEPVVDPASESDRPARYGDVAVLVHSTWNVGLLVEALDRLGVPWSARGGTLFLDDPLHRQLLLGLRAVADRDDGVAAAAVRPPFFALDVLDLARARAPEAPEADEGVARARAAEALVRDLRRRRLERPPGETARDLLERTGFARAVALGPNGAQRLERLRELCFEVERVAAAEGLDFDGVTARLREWALDPPALDPPHPVGGDAVRILTIHQAKGLEFPVVVWWDARAPMAARDFARHWFVERTGKAWAMSLDGLAWQEPETGDFLAKERAFGDAERRRLVYVAATRARDLLVLPVTAKSEVTRQLLGKGETPAVVAQESWTDAGPPAWARQVQPPALREPRAADALAASVERDWVGAAAEAARPRLVPRGVAAEADRAAEAEAQAEGEAGARPRARPGRFGPAFGEAVHARRPRPSPP